MKTSKKTIGLLLASTLFLLILTACNSSPASNTTSTAKPEKSASTETDEYVFAEQTIVFTGISSLESLEGKVITGLKEVIGINTNNKVKFDINLLGTLYTQDEQIPAVMSGDLDMCYATIGSLGDYAPEMTMFYAPHLFKDSNHFKAWFKSDAWAKEVDKVAEKTGLRILAVGNIGVCHAVLREDRKVTSREDLADIKLRMPNNAAQIFLGQAMGGNVVGMSFSDVYLALQTGTIDGISSTYAIVKDNSFYEVAKSITETNDAFATEVICINENLWKSMSPELQQVIQDAVTNCLNDLTVSTETQDEEYKAFMEKQGMSIYKMSDEEYASYEKSITEYVFSAAGDEFRAKWDMDLYNAVQELAK